MKKNYFFIILLFLTSFCSYGQNTGDFRSKTTGIWTDSTSWESWDGSLSSWGSASSYPGEIIGTNTVTIQTGHTITIASNLSTASMGEITINGTLNLQGGANPKQINLGTTLLYISSVGILNFSNQKTELYLPNNAVIKIDSGGNISGACSNNTEIYIDNKLIAVCNGSTGNVLTFGEIVAGSGTLNANIITPNDFTTTICNGIDIQLSGGYTGTPNGIVNYLWTVKDPNYNDVTITNNTSTSTSFTPSIAGEYTISFSVTDGSAFTNTETKTVIVQSLVTSGSIGNAQTICSGTSPTSLTSIDDGTADGTITYEWQTNTSGSYVTIPTVNTVTYSPPALTASTSYKRRTVSTLNGVECYSAYTTPVTITVEDVTPPVTPILADINVGECAGTPTAPTTTDNCAGTITGTPNVSFPITTQGTTIVTWTFADGNGNSVIANQNVIVDDITNPILTPETNQDITINTSCIATIPNLVDGSSATDNCTGTTITQSPAAGTTQLAIHNGTINVTVTATDAAGNIDTEIVVLTAKDATNPTLTTGNNQSANTAAGLCTAPVVITDAVFSDNCSGATIAYTLSGATIKTTTAGQVGTYTFNKGITTINYTVTDAAGNIITGSKTVTITDSINPTITAGANQTANTAAGLCTASVAVTDAVFSDNCTGAAISYTLSGATTKTTTAGQVGTYTFNKGVTTINYRVTDASGRIITGSKTVTVTDNIPPSISCPANITVNTSANGTGDCSTTVTLGTPTTNDNCGIASIDPRVGGNSINQVTYAFPIGNTTVTWIVTDNSGLTSSCNQIVTVVDNENPSVSCPGDQNVSYDSNCQFLLQDYTSLTTTSDNCDSNLTITQSPAPGTLISSALTTVILTARDDANRTSSCTFQVIAIDNIAPTAVCQNYTAYLSTNGTINIAALNLDNGSYDNCGIANMTVSPNSFNCSNVGANTVTFTVFDNSGNSDSCTAIVTVVDSTPPTMICKNYVVVVDAITRVATINASNINNGSNDACGIASLSVSPSVFPESPNVYYTTTTLTAVDINGNSSTCTATVTVEPPKNQFTYLTGEIVNPIPDNPQPPSALVEVTACPGGITVPKDIKFTLQAIGNYDLQASDVLNWEYSNDNGETWIVIPNTAGLLTYTLIGLTSDTFVRLRITDADDPLLIKTSSEAYARFLPPDEPPIIVSHTALDICLNDSVTVNAESFYDQPNGQFGEGGEFNYAQPDGWRVDGLDGFFPASGDNGSETTWKETNSNNNALFSNINYDTSDNTKFAIAHGVANTTTLETPVFSTIGMTSSEAILNFNTSYYFCNGGYGEIWLSFDSGNTYTIQLNTVEAFNFTSGNTTGVELIRTGGNCTNGQRPTTNPRMIPATINLGAYAGLSGLRVKFIFHGSTTTCQNVTFPKASGNTCTNNPTYNVASGWAIDAVGFAYAQVDDELEWTDEDGTVIATGTTATVTPVTPGIREYGVTTLVNGCRTDNGSGTNYININTSLAYAGEDYTPLASNCGESALQLNAYDNTKTAVTNFNKGAWKNNLYVVPDTASGDTDYLGTGVTGAWSIISSSSSSCGNSATFSSATDPDAIFTADPGSYTLRWTLTNGCFDELNVTLIDCKTVDFDGTNDYVTFKNNYNINSNFSIEVWVKPSSVSNTRTVFSRKDAGNNSNGYDLTIVNGQVIFNWYNSTASGSVTTGTYTIGIDRWYHLAVTFDGSTYKLYVDGIELGSVNGTAPALTADNIEALLGAMDQANNPTNYFHGWIDELKIWNKALSAEHIRQMMNQEINASGSDVGGVVIPLKIYGTDNDNNGIEDNPLSWNDLLGYYRMDVVCGNLEAFKGVSGRLHNINSSEQQTAPIPYTTRTSNQTWDTDNTWTNFSVWDVPNSKGINNEPIDWNIVKTNHKVTSNAQDLTLLGLIVMSNELLITNSGTQDETNPGHGLWITHYLKLDGSIDLIGESQLVEKRYYFDDDNGALDAFGKPTPDITVQFSESILDATSSGYIERDQQGQQNSFNYNYWSSPVSTIQGLINNTPYSLTGILRDGTISSAPKTITFGDGAFYADGTLSISIKISKRWLWSYNSATPDSNTNWQNYYQWNYISSTGLLKTGEGFTMKGTGGTAPIKSMQNYVFVGKPNSGDITLSLPPEQTYLIGNPYPSALDADKFIKDNLIQSTACPDCTGTTNVFSGALYFWDHFGITNNHVLAQYTGGYATYTLAGGVAGIANDPLNINNGTTGSKIPQQYIPVAQAFFINGMPRTSIPVVNQLNFKNSQRAFVRETSGSSIFMKSKTADKMENVTIDNRSKIRLGFDSPTGMHRQLLVGADSNTTNLFDIGYDAPMFGVNTDDMFWEINNIEFVIQAIPDFNVDQIIPLGLTIANEGKATIKIDTLENISETTKIYLHDNITGIYHDIRNSDFKISLVVGEYKNRFSLQFTNKTLGLDENNLNDGLEVLYSTNYKVLIILNKIPDVTVNDVQLFNLLGQAIENWDVENINQTRIQIPIKNVASGVYIVKLKTSKGEYSKKIIIK